MADTKMLDLLLDYTKWLISNYNRDFVESREASEFVTAYANTHTLPTILDANSIKKATITYMDAVEGKKLIGEMFGLNLITSDEWQILMEDIREGLGLPRQKPPKKEETK